MGVVMGVSVASVVMCGLRRSITLAICAMRMSSWGWTMASQLPGNRGWIIPGADGSLRLFERRPCGGCLFPCYREPVGYFRVGTPRAMFVRLSRAACVSGSPGGRTRSHNARVSCSRVIASPSRPTPW